jgi:hypothetical protein
VDTLGWVSGTTGLHTTKSAFSEKEEYLCFAVVLRYGFATRTKSARVLWWYGYEQSAPPHCFVFQLTAQLEGGSRMRESRSYGSVRGAISDGRPYRNT